MLFQHLFVYIIIVCAIFTFVRRDVLCPCHVNEVRRRSLSALARITNQISIYLEIIFPVIIINSSSGVYTEYFVLWNVWHLKTIKPKRINYWILPIRYNNIIYLHIYLNNFDWCTLTIAVMASAVFYDSCGKKHPHENWRLNLVKKHSKDYWTASLTCRYTGRHKHSDVVEFLRLIFVVVCLLFWGVITDPSAFNSIIFTIIFFIYLWNSNPVYAESRRTCQNDGACKWRAFSLLVFRE